MLQTIIVVGGLMFFCGILLSPFYFFRKKNIAVDSKNYIYKEISWLKGTFVFIVFCIYFVAILLYFVLKDEIGIRLGFIPAFVFFGGFIYLYQKIKDIRFYRNNDNKKIGLQEKQCVSNEVKNKVKKEHSILKWLKKKKLYILSTMVLLVLIISTNSFLSNKKINNLECLKIIDFSYRSKSYSIVDYGKRRFFKDQK